MKHVLVAAGCAAALIAVAPLSAPVANAAALRDPAFAIDPGMVDLAAGPARIASRRWAAEPPPSVVFAGRRAHASHDAYERGMRLLRERRFPEAVEAFRQSIDDGVKEEASTYNIACAYARAGEKDRAFEWLAKADEIGFPLERYLDRDDDLDSLRDDARFAALEKRLGGGYAEEKRRRKERAAAKLERLLRDSPDDGRSFDRAGRELLDARDWTGAAKAFAEAARLGFREPTSLYNQACALSRNGEKAAALEALEKSLAAGFDNAGHLDDDDDLDGIRGEPRFAELRKAARDLRLSGGDHFGVMQALGLSDSWHAAARRYRRWTSDRTFGGRASFNLGFAELKRDEPEAARDAFRRAYELGYRRPTTMYNLACAYARLGQKDAAFEWLFKSIDAGFKGADGMSSDDDLRSLRRDPRFAKARERARAIGEDED
jgi:tetratricopeptide (TPR) repeat protein